MSHRKCECRCEQFLGKLWSKLIDSVTMRHGYEETSFKAIVDALSPRDWEVVQDLVEFTRSSCRDVIDIAVQQCNVLTPKEEWDKIYEEEIVPLKNAFDFGIAQKSISAS